MKRLRIALAQINPTVGALEANRKKIAGLFAAARRGGADLVVFPELALTGYPPEDLLLKPAFLKAVRRTLAGLEPAARGLTALVGFAETDAQGRVYNAAAVLSGGRLKARYRKMRLPNYGVFDEKRYFSPGQRPMVLEAGRVRVGVSICEDLWVEAGPVRSQAAAGASVLVNLSASPYHAGKLRERERLFAARARRFKAWVVYTNLVGGQDELVFDGGSLVIDPKGRVVFRGAQFKEGLYFVDLPATDTRYRRGLRYPVPKGVEGPGTEWGVERVRVSFPAKPAARGTASRSVRSLEPDAEVFEALTLGLKDYVVKNGFRRVVLGMSGGIDSAVTAAIATDALGSGAVRAVSMPSQYSSEGTRTDARRTAQALGIEFLEIPIERIFRAFEDRLAPVFKGREADLTEENLQARIRGTILMALSNKFGWLVLATGNKSELSTGYCTLYGDMVGGFAVIKDVPKGRVYRLAREANRRFGRAVIPDSVLKRPPSAELRAGQKDRDTLPPYGKLDTVIRAYVECRLPAGEIRRTFPSAAPMVDWILRRIDANEYKRRQAPLGIKITPVAFGKDRRMPVTNHFKET